MRKTIYIAAGCFWGGEKYFSVIRGVLETKVGYANGNTTNPSYEDVCRRNTGHAETVEIIYEDSILPLGKLLNLYYQVIDPISINKQGGDIGTQYRTGIYYVEKTDLPVIEDSLQKLATNYTLPIAIEVKPLENFYPAEEYHQSYLDKNPSGYCHIGQCAIDAARKA